MVYLVWNGGVRRYQKKNEISRSKVRGKLDTDTIRYNGNTKRAVKTRTAKNIAGTAVKAGILGKIGYDFISTGRAFKKDGNLIKLTGISDPKLESKVKKAIIGTTLTIGTLATAKAIKSAAKGVRKQQYINEYSYENNKRKKK